MTVKELIEVLKELDDDLPISVCGEKEGSIHQYDDLLVFDTEPPKDDEAIIDKGWIVADW